MPRRAAVLFDLFDTLCRIDEGTYLEGKAAAANLLDLPRDAFLTAWVSAGELSQVGRLPEVRDRVRHVAALLGRESVPDAVVEAVAVLEGSTLLRATTLHEDVLPLLKRLRPRPALKLALVSNASASAEALVAHLGLDRFFDTAIYSFRVGAVKPDPAIYEAACLALAVRPGECLFVGDGNAGELDGAKALGMFAARIERVFSLSPYRRRESRTFDASLRSLAEVEALLEG